ncbi:MAG: glycoside hydrolase family 9 protein [Planctomycetota bacterium]
MIRFAILSCLFAAGLLAQSASPYIRIDQFGYRPLAKKIAVLRDPVIGFDASGSFTPGAVIEVRRMNGSVAWTGAATAWNGGAVHAQSGDRVWWFDFSALEELGEFVVVDVASGESSEPFEIASGVYAPVLRDAVRMYLHQRCGVAKSTPFVDGAWNDGACHLGAEQDLDCRSVLNPVASTSRDLSGGWHDAGDYNKYVNFADDALHGLLAAYELAPAAWPDNWDLPESGNDVPDLLDEIRHELEWLLKMQNADGSLLHKVSVTDFSASSPPSADIGPRRYAPATASATISACGVFARAAEAFARLFVTSSFAAVLDQAALSAWAWLDANPGLVPSSYDNTGFVNVSAEDSAYWQTANRVRAAVWLYRRTGLAAYKNFVEANYQQLTLLQVNWASMYEQELNEALLLYATLPGATPTVAADIFAAYEGSLANYHLPPQLAGDDAYRAWLADADHTWGSNRTKALEGSVHLALSVFGRDGQGAEQRLEAAAGYLHYLHGLNPNGFCYLTNMSAAGADGSVNETYHAWFADGTIWDSASASLHGPPPGFLTGGPNPSYAPASAYTGPVLSPPQNQPIQKSYRDWNTNWPQNSWEVTECHIPYQAAYIRLLAAFAVAPPPRLGLDLPTLQSGASAVMTVHSEPGVPTALLWGLSPAVFAASTPGWCVELGIDVAADLAFHLVGIVSPGANGEANFLAGIPLSVSGIEIYLQATAAFSCPEPRQSAVVKRKIG